MSSANVVGALVLATLCAGCASTAVPEAPSQQSITVDKICDQARTLERNLSDGGVFLDNDQVYLMGDGTLCRFLK